MGDNFVGIENLTDETAWVIECEICKVKINRDKLWSIIHCRKRDNQYFFKYNFTEIEFIVIYEIDYSSEFDNKKDFLFVCLQIKYIFMN